MPKPKIPNSRKAALEHRKRIERYTALINQLYDKLNKEAAKIALSTGHDPAAQFLWSDYSETRKALKELQEQYVSDMKGIVMAGTSAEWKESNLVQDLVAQKLLKAYTGTTKAGDEYARYFQTDPDALKAFQQRKAGGMNLSQRVWNLSEQYKTELEMALSAAIEPGTSAMELAADIKTYLNEPDKMFRRFRYKDEEGNWQRKWKQKVTDADGKVHFVDADPKAYHPGRGVYRSSARNAQRLARTEINMAYRKAEQERWKSFDFVVGYEVKITQNGKHVEDICDCLKGKYRKDFKFMGWHPMCMCYTIPILKTEDEFFDDDDDAKSVNEVEDVPQGFVDWIKDNKERIDKAEKRGKLPYFIADNRKCVEDILKKDNEEDESITIKIGDRSWTLKEMISECTVEKTENGRIYLHPEHGKTEKAESLDFARWRAEHFNEEVILLPNPQGTKSADSYNITRKVQEEYKRGKTPTLNAIDRLLRDGAKQSKYVILEIDCDATSGVVSDALNGRLKRCNIKEVRIKIGESEAVYSRDIIIQDGFNIKPEDFHIMTVSRSRGSSLKKVEPSIVADTDAKLRKFFSSAK